MLKYTNLALFLLFFHWIIHKSCLCKHVVTAVRKPCVRRAVCALLWRPRQVAHGGELMLTKDNLDQHNETRRLCDPRSSEAHLIFISLVFFTGIVAPPPLILPEVGRVSTHKTSRWSSFVLFLAADCARLLFLMGGGKMSDDCASCLALWPG